MNKLAVQWALEQALELPEAKLTLVVLSRNADERGHVPPTTLDDIADIVGIDRMAVHKHVHELAGKGLLKITCGDSDGFKRHENRYRLINQWVFSS